MKWHTSRLQNGILHDYEMAYLKTMKWHTSRLQNGMLQDYEWHTA